MKPDYQTMNDGCDGDSQGLRDALGDDYEVITEVRDEQGYGAHDSNAVFRTASGKIIHADCGGCSCGGTGNWDYVTSEGEAMRMIPESARTSS